MRYLSFCSGVEAASLAWMPLGWEAVAFSEIETFPCAVLKERFPDVPNLGDCTKIHYDKNTEELYVSGADGIVSRRINAGRIDLCVGGFPCFAAGAMVLTPQGYRPIEDIEVGDCVITHLGNIQKVTAVNTRQAVVGKVKVVGRPKIECTAEHPFYSMEVKRDCRRNSETYSQLIQDSDYEFIDIAKSVGRYAGRIYPDAPVCDINIPCIYNGSVKDTIELAGWYIGDGYIRKTAGKNKKAVVLALVSEKKISDFKNRFDGIFNFTVAGDGKIYISNTDCADFFIANFGELSHTKRIPYWMYSNEFKEDFIKGYSHTDGFIKNEALCFTTTSKALAYGVADLLMNASVAETTVKPTTVIGGRKVNQRNWYLVSSFKNPKRTKFFNGRYASRIKEFESNGAIRTVYNITVDGEHTYIVNGLAVHNCQSFSVAGKRTGLKGASGLILEYFRLLKEIEPQWVVYENVPGMLSSEKGRDFGIILDGFRECGYHVAWRVLDAQYVRVDGYPRAVPQRRRRVFVVGHLGEWQYPASVLFEPDCLFRDTPPRRVKGKGFTTGFAGGSGMASGIDGNNSATVDGHCGLPNGSNLAGRLWDASGVNPTLNQCSAGSGIIGASNQELFSQNANGLVIESGKAICDGIAPTLDASYPAHLNHQDTGKLVVEVRKFWNGNDYAECLTAKGADDRMPDKGKLPCVITESEKGFYSESAVGQTLEAHEDQHRRNIVCRATQQGNAESMIDCCPTITEAAGKSGNNQPIICAGFCQGASPAAGSIGYHEQVSPTIKAGESGTAQVPALLCVHGSQDPITNTDHANAVNRNNGLENCVCQYGEVAGTLTERHDSSPCADRGMTIVYENHMQDSRIKECGGCSPQINAKAGTGGGNLPLVQEVFSVDALSSNSMKSDNPNSGFHRAEVAKTLDTTIPTPQKNQGGQCVVEQVGYYPSQYQNPQPCETPCITAGNCNTIRGDTPLVQAVAIAENIIGRKVENGGNGTGAQEELSYTLNATGVHGVSQNATVRRLTPVECERLMGFPEVNVLEIGRMTKDEFIAWEIAVGNITVDTENGLVYSTRTSGGRKSESPILLEGTETPTGYLVASLREKEDKRQCRVHRIIWIAEHGVPPEGMTIDHINNDKKDNRLVNLQLMTSIENSSKAHADGLVKHKTKISDEQKNEIITLYQEHEIPIRKLATMFGISKSRVHQLIHSTG